MIWILYIEQAEEQFEILGAAASADILKTIWIEWQASEGAYPLNDPPGGYRYTTPLDGDVLRALCTQEEWETDGQEGLQLYPTRFDVSGYGFHIIPVPWFGP